MWGENNYPNINIHLYEDDNKNMRYEEAVVAVCYATPDFLDLTNEGAPVSLGNAYGAYEFVAFNQCDYGSYLFTYRFGPNEWAELKERGEVVLTPLVDNTLADMPDPFRPEWA